MTPRLILVFPLLIFTAGQSWSELIRLDSNRQLFLDDHLIESSRNVKRTIHQLEKFQGNPVLYPTEPWEHNMTILYGAVIRDQGKYRMWYYGPPGVCYAESADGVQWEKPELGLVQYEGRETNIVIDRHSPDSPKNPFSHFYELFTVIKDEREQDPSRRYKMGVLCIHRDYEGEREDPYHRGQRRGLGVAASPDGIHWEKGSDWATEAICDGGTSIIWDPLRRRYVLYGRTKLRDPKLLAAWNASDWVEKHYWGRAVTRTESDDLIHWDEEDPASAPVVMAADEQDPPGVEIYSMPVFPYEGIYIGLVQAFYNVPDKCFLDIQLAVSRDGIRFERVGDRSAFIPVGEEGDWDLFNTSVANSPPIPVGNELRFYYSGRKYRHGPYQGPDKGEKWSATGFGGIKRDRFVSLDGSFDDAELVTKPLVFGPGKLHLNAKADFGQIGIEVLDSDGAVLTTSSPVTGDRLDHVVNWNGNREPPLDEPVRLRIRLTNARLFSIWTE